jgi:hypothetical protein
MDDYQMARLALDAVRTATRIAQQEQRRRERNRQQAQAPRSSGAAAAEDRDALQRRPEFDMPTSSNGEIPDEFLPRM